MVKKRESKPAFDWKQYPKPDKERCGIKVSWNYYADRSRAEECAEAAKHNAIRQYELGYDFGYCSPGTIYPGTGEYAGLWEVCLP